MDQESDPIRTIRPLTANRRGRRDTPTGIVSPRGSVISANGESMGVFVRSPKQPRWLVAAITCAVALTSAGCATARIRKENALALAAADGKVLEGCYDCLQDARRRFE